MNVSSVSTLISAERSFNLVAFAKKHRYRLRNLHDGGPIPPAIYRRPKGAPPAGQVGYIGEDDRQDAIVGHQGSITDEGETGMLSICLHYRSTKGVNRARARIQEIGGIIRQEGDDEIAGSIPIEKIEEALQLIKVSKLHPGNDNFGNPLPTRDPCVS